MSRVEDILYEAYELGILKKVFRESSKIDKTHPNIEVADKFDMALQNVKQRKKQKKKKIKWV